MFSKANDKFLAAIVAGVIVLVGAAVYIVLVRPAPSYLAEDTPEGVTHNYLFALQQKDYVRMYDYLSTDLRGRPKDARDFEDQVSHNTWRFRMPDNSTTWAVQDSRVTQDRATVSVQQTHFNSSSLFGSSQYSNIIELRLRQQDGAWKIIDADAYWLDCWDESGGCP